MTAENDFKAVSENISSALINTTRTTALIAKEDIAFQRSLNPDIGRLLDDQNSRLLSLVQDLNRTATAGADITVPSLRDVESVDDNWREIVDIVDSLLEKADACLDEFTGIVKKAGPSHSAVFNPLSVPAKRQLASGEYRNQSIPKPQRLFRNVPNNAEAIPFKPLLRSKPNAIVPLEESLKPDLHDDGTDQFKHPYEVEIIRSRYPKTAFIQRDPTPYMPYETTNAVWVDTLEAVYDMLGDLRKAQEIAVDLEHHDIHSYVGLVSLMQISTRDQDWIVDTLQPWREDLQVLNEVFTDPNIIKVLHGSNSDIVWLQRDLGLYIVGLFDTYHAAKALDYPRKALAYLLARFVNFEADKKYQMADWRIRPLPKQMFEYARSDTHFLLYIYDHMRNELLSKSALTVPNKNLVDVVCEHSKVEALQRYERFFYDSQHGSGVYGWYSILSRMPGLLSKEQFAVFRVVHEWRDTAARDEDESTQYVLSKQGLFNIAREMPTKVASLLACCSPPSKIIRSQADHLVALIAKAKLEGATGPDFTDIIKPRGFGYRDQVSRINDPATTFNIANNSRPSVVSTESSSLVAIFDRSRFWGRMLSKDAALSSKTDNSSHTEDLCLALPLPPLTAEIFDQDDSEAVISKPENHVNPGSRAEHVYTKKRKQEAEDTFIVKDAGGAKKRKAQLLNGEESAILDRVHANTEATSVGMSLDTETSLHCADSQAKDEKEARKAERKLQKRRKKEQNKQRENQRVSGVEASPYNGVQPEAFDYEQAPSLLHGNKQRERPEAKIGFDPYSKSLDAPKGAPRPQKETSGKSMTYGN